MAKVERRREQLDAGTRACRCPTKQVRSWENSQLDNVAVGSRSWVLFNKTVIYTPARPPAAVNTIAVAGVKHIGRWSPATAWRHDAVSPVSPRFVVHVMCVSPDFTDPRTASKASRPAVSPPRKKTTLIYPCRRM